MVLGNSTSFVKIVRFCVCVRCILRCT